MKFIIYIGSNGLFKFFNMYKYWPISHLKKQKEIFILFFSTEGGTVSFILPVEGTSDKFLVSIGRKLAIVTWDGTSSKVSNVEIFAEIEKEDKVKNNRFNDGKTDPAGRLWAGKHFIFTVKLLNNLFNNLIIT